MLGFYQNMPGIRSKAVLPLAAVFGKRNSKTRRGARCSVHNEKPSSVVTDFANADYLKV